MFTDSIYFKFAHKFKTIDTHVDNIYWVEKTLTFTTPNKMQENS